MFFIAAPFGNHLRFRSAISVTGSWTREPRPGVIKQIIKTLRPIQNGWVNKIGLRNPGIECGLKKHKLNDVLSLALVESNDWEKLYEIVPKTYNVEINISCPNLLDWQEHFPLYNEISLFPKDNRKWCICKIPPTYSPEEIDNVIDLGYRQIHTSNTLRCANGGISGKELIPYTLKNIDHIKKEYPDVEVIAGGGVYNKEVINMYNDHGADHISLGTICFKPWKIKGLIESVC